MMMDEEPHPSIQDIQISIPDRDKAQAVRAVPPARPTARPRRSRWQFRRRRGGRGRRSLPPKNPPAGKARTESASRVADRAAAGDTRTGRRLRHLLAAAHGPSRNPAPASPQSPPRPPPRKRPACAP
jgi:hypothetical protein